MRNAVFVASALAMALAMTAVPSAQAQETEQCFGVWRGGSRRLLQVRAGAEGLLAGASQNRNPNVISVAHFDQMGAQRLERLEVERIECLGSIEGNPRDVLLNFELDRHFYLSAENTFDLIHMALVEFVVVN